MLRFSELKEMMDGRAKWQGITKRGGQDPDVEEAVRGGLVMRCPDREGYIITEKGREFVRRGGH